ncbi:MAG: alkyl hydroperoxide reductase and/or thiol-specific antioxidant family (AhpC/TSA) protein [Sediminibacterium sp.]|nr:alkyl hydroperoxide reductase and/or thiol-specific antioxidant family (AhpC/TSA) protein [Sediminibacterium sp.]
MKPILAVLIACLATGYCPAQSTLAIGSPVPLGDAPVKDISGKNISIKQAARQNGVLVMFSCNTCPYVIRNQARTRVLTTYARQNNIGVILLNSNEGGRDDGDSFIAMQAYAQEQGYDFYYALDTGSRLANAFGATRTPEVYLFDAAGILQYKGAIDDNPSDGGNVKRVHAREAINEMVGGKPVSVKESRSLGCAIKRN